MDLKLADWLEDYFKFHVCRSLDNVEFSMEVELVRHLVARVLLSYGLSAGGAVDEAASAG
jgi:hypothetical protein